MIFNLSIVGALCGRDVSRYLTLLQSQSQRLRFHANFEVSSRLRSFEHLMQVYISLVLLWVEENAPARTFRRKKRDTRSGIRVDTTLIDNTVSGAFAQLADGCPSVPCTNRG